MRRAGDTLRDRKLKSVAFRCMKEQLSINHYSEIFYLCREDEGGGELFSPQAAQSGLYCWQRTGDSSNCLIQHFSGTSWKNPRKGSLFRCCLFLKTLVRLGRDQYIVG